MQYRTLSLALLLASACVSPAIAQEPANGRRVLRIDLQVQGTEGWRSGGSHESATLRQHFYFATVLEPAEDRISVNHQDADSVRRTQERSLAMQAEVARGQRQQPPPGQAASMAAMQKQVNDAIAQAYARCKGDEKCITEAVTRAHSGLMAPPPGATMQPGAVRDAHDEPAEIYRQWFSYEDCPGVVRVARHDTSTGAIADVGGARPRQRERKAQVDREVRDICLPYTMSVVDEQAGKLYLPAYAFPAQATAQAAAGADAGAMTVPPQIAQYLTQLFKGAPLSGTKTETLVLARPILVSPLGNTYAGKVKVTVKWDFAQPYQRGTRLPRP